MIEYENAQEWKVVEERKRREKEIATIDEKVYTASHLSSFRNCKTRTVGNFLLLVEVDGLRLIDLVANFLILIEFDGFFFLLFGFVFL